MAITHLFLHGKVIKYFPKSQRFNHFFAILVKSSLFRYTNPYSENNKTCRWVSFYPPPLFYSLQRHIFQGFCPFFTYIFTIISELAILIKKYFNFSCTIKNLVIPLPPVSSEVFKHLRGNIALLPDR